MPARDDVRAGSALILEARGLGLRRGDRWILEALSLEVARGKVVGLLGPNGAGKSTAFGLLAGLSRADAGEVRLDGARVCGWPLHRRAGAGLGYLPQGPSLFPRLSVNDNLRLAEADAGRVAAALEAAGLGALGRRSASTLSGGERRRVELVRALLLHPRVLLLDEPWAGVDPMHVAALRAQIRAFAEAGGGVLLTDHAVREALELADEVLLLDRGRVLVRGTPAEVASHRGARSAFLGEDF
ncbi:MAG: ATP-binding cassette domain-containing protein [Deltaproteobacteria bacterium]|nr:ATP-binding cassette domain-containing protein [Deltaproteobacteria bacterium]